MGSIKQYMPHNPCELPLGSPDFGNFFLILEDSCRAKHFVINNGTVVSQHSPS